MADSLGMVILTLRSNDSELRGAFARYSELFDRATDREVPFQQKVELLRKAEVAKNQVEHKIAALHVSGAVKVNKIPESRLTKDDKLQNKYLLLNGLYDKTQLQKIVMTTQDQLTEEMQDELSLLQPINADEYVLFWNMGELEANDLLQN